MGQSATIPPPWVRQIILCTFGYFTVSGILGVVAPQALLHLLGAISIGAEWIVQLAGLLTFLFGLLFPFAAVRPYEYWPILFVAFLGQLAVPAFVLHLALTGVLPTGPAACMMLVDLLFALALGAVLHHVSETFVKEDATKPELAQALSLKPHGSAESLLELSMTAPLLVVCLRHSGCTFCRETLARLSKERAALEHSGVRLILVSLGSAIKLREVAVAYGLGDLPVVSDPERALYRALELPRGALFRVLGWRELWSALLEGQIFRHGIGVPDGDTLQLPGSCIIQGGTVLALFRAEHASEQGSFSALKESCQLPE